MGKYQVFGLTIETDMPFVHNLVKANSDDPVNVRITYSPGFWPEYNLGKENLVYQNPYKTETVDTLFSVYKFPDCYILNYGNFARFYLFSNQICYQPFENFTQHWVETILLSSVFAIWLELQGTVCLHASAVVVDQSGLAFLSHSGGGKTTLAMSMIQADYSLLSDDILPIRQSGSVNFGLPAFPTMRTWPIQAKHFIDSPEILARVVPGYEKRLLPIGTGIFGQFATNPVPLRCFYLLERSTADSLTTIDILPVPPSQALIELIKQSFAARAAAGLGLSNQRLGILANLARTVTMRKLIYPSGIDHLFEVRQAILADVM